MEYDNSFKHRGDRPGHNWGDYQFVDHGYDQLAADPTTDVGTMIPGLNQLTAIEMRGRLQFIRSDLRPALIQALGFTSLVLPSQVAVPPGTPSKPCVQGFAKVLVTGQTDAWIARAVSGGSAVLMGLSEALQGKGSFMLCTDVRKIVELATAGYVGGDLPTQPHGWAIVDGPAQLLDAAVAASQPQPQLPVPAQPAPEPGLPDWVLPVGIGVGALGLIALVVTSGKKKR
jgi:hypothetical protein